MPFVPNTPEALLGRSDSKNPATTCKGMTASGRPCRNRISPSKAADAQGGVVAVVAAGDATALAAFFCARHKDQAAQLAAAAVPHSQKHGSNQTYQATALYPLQGRNSIDSLMAKFSVLELDETGAPPAQAPVQRPPTWEQVPGPLMAVPSDLVAQHAPRPSRPPRRKKAGFWESLCCLPETEDDYVEVVRHKKRIHNQNQSQTQVHHHAAMPTRPEMQMQTVPPPAFQQPPPASPHRPRPQQMAAPASPASGRKPARPSTGRPSTVRPNTGRPSDASSGDAMSYIPVSLAAHTASKLLAELAKSISAADKAGYIYIFWLTPDEAGPAPSAAAASSLLAPPERARPHQARQTSDLLRQYSVRRAPPGAPRSPGHGAQHHGEKRTILLKIGRANNVYRRMNEWKAQCGYTPSLVRFYPHVSGSSPSPSPSPAASPARARPPPSPRTAGSEAVHPVPHVNRVERLVHLELAEQRVLQQCATCDKQHREWFEVDASRDGLAAVDAVVKRWVRWAEDHAEAS